MKETISQRAWLEERLGELRQRAERIELMASELPRLHEQIEKIEARLRRPSPTGLVAPSVNGSWSRRKDAGLDLVMRWAGMIDVDVFAVVDIEIELGYSHTSACRIVRRLVDSGMLIRLGPGKYALARSRVMNAAA